MAECLWANAVWLKFNQYFIFNLNITSSQNIGKIASLNKVKLIGGGTNLKELFKKAFRNKALGANNRYE